MSFGWFLYVFHLFFVSAIFLYIGLYRTDIPRWIFPGLLGLGSIVGLYHLYKAYLHVSEGTVPWVNMIHILVVAPLLISIGYFQTETPRFVFELMLMVGFAVSGYHVVKIYRELNGCDGRAKRE